MLLDLPRPAVSSLLPIGLSRNLSSPGTRAVRGRQDLGGRLGAGQGPSIPPGCVEITRASSLAPTCSAADQNGAVNQPSLDMNPL